MPLTSYDLAAMVAVSRKKVNTAAAELIAAGALAHDDGFYTIVEPQSRGSAGEEDASVI